MNTDTVFEPEEADFREGVTFLERRRQQAVFAAPVVMALWNERVFAAFQPPDLGRTA
jgi:hypothetical protein